MNSLHLLLTSYDRLYMGHEPTQNTSSTNSSCQSSSTQPSPTPNPRDESPHSDHSHSDDNDSQPPHPRSSPPNSPNPPWPSDEHPSYDLTHTQPSDVPCTSSTCGVPGVPHTQGAYQHRRPFHPRARRYHPWGWSDPPPAVWAALRRVTRAGLPEHWLTFAMRPDHASWPLRRDCALVAGFVAHHSLIWHPDDAFLEWAEMWRGEDEGEDKGEGEGEGR